MVPAPVVLLKLAPIYEVGAPDWAGKTVLFPWNHPVVPIVVLWLVCTQPAPGNVVMSSNPCPSGVPHGDGVGVPPIVAVGVAVAVAVGVADGVPLGVAVGLAHDPSSTLIVSMRHPVADTLLSEAIRKRNLIVRRLRSIPGSPRC